MVLHPSSFVYTFPTFGVIDESSAHKKVSRNITLQETKLLEKTFFSIHISITCTLSDENEECKRDLFLILLKPARGCHYDVHDLRVHGVREEHGDDAALHILLVWAEARDERACICLS